MQQAYRYGMGGSADGTGKRLRRQRDRRHERGFLEDAARVAIDTASANVRDLRVAEVVKMDATVEDGRIALFRVRMNISFKYESG